MFKFEEMKRHCEAQQEFYIRAVNTRGMGEVVYLKKEFEKETHFEEPVAIVKRCTWDKHR